MIPLNKTLDRKHIPDRIYDLPRDERGFPIPWFVHRDTRGVPDFRVIGRNRIRDALSQNLCWICGNRLAKQKVFVIGPMCAINRVSGEPPSHRSCAMFAAQGCPFLTQPRMRRNEVGIEGHTELGGTMLKHNPGATAVWITQDFRLMPVDNGMLFRVGEPVAVLWFAQGRAATRGEVVDAMKRGLPYLLDMARDEGREAVEALLHQIAVARQYLPPREPDHASAQSTATEGPAAPAGDQQRATAPASGDVRAGDDTPGQEPGGDRAPRSAA